MSATAQSFDYLKQFIQKKLDCSTANWKPLIIGIEGPQGSGKTYLSTKLTKKLSEEYPSLKIVTVSMDDFYFTFQEQLRITQSNPGNMLLEGRGLPGTHDLKLLLECFDKIQMGQLPISIPFYDKSLHGGKGDRANMTEWNHVTDRKIDVVLFEGWFNGYLPYDDDTQLLSNWKKIQSEWNPKFNSLSLEHISKLNQDLKNYVKIWKKFDCFVYLTTTNLSNVYKWRLQQEHNLIQTRGIGMSDDEVESFVNRYMPAYHLYYHRLSEITKLVPDTLRLDIGLDREVINIYKASL
ncbi:hypothetical protein CANARDRAFT_8562 [[Candida] arabinofermentans NRRL YB-2248]|uniref:Channel forming colicins domain-containing protein n=1 Tax=[Candida] arabinofermentans NRRL YB-2248 TaxID=983967 RepID=A0A1E4SYK9_9ASCO|nr:hypothetical protein CANARDRAFT_8562 [[Candida] arabinofermentans NRRL YB-2248]